MRYSWINVHILVPSLSLWSKFSKHSRWPLFFSSVVWPILVQYRKKCQHFHTTLCFTVKNAAGPGGQGLNLGLFLVKLDFLVGGSGAPWHFLLWRALFIWPEDSAHSHHVPVVNKRTGPHHNDPGLARSPYPFKEGEAGIDTFICYFSCVDSLASGKIREKNINFCYLGDIYSTFQHASPLNVLTCHYRFLMESAVTYSNHPATVRTLLLHPDTQVQMGQWHNSCNDPNVLMSHMSHQFYFKLLPSTPPSSLHPLPPRCLLSFKHSLPIPFNIQPPSQPSCFSFLSPTPPVCLSACLSMCQPVCPCMPSLSPSHPLVSPCFVPA